VPYLTEDRIRQLIAYHPADTPERVQAHEAVRAWFSGLLVELYRSLSEQGGESPELTKAVDAALESAMRFNQHVAVNFPHGDGTPIKQEQTHPHLEASDVIARLHAYGSTFDDLGAEHA